ncbi:hypothetical protein [Paraburkholderia sp. SIMBA_053]|uniref:hypothetical protein n=1 Tax=Paraburkholderia sp. SIMBA_053 TaxID=3085794 RepID=UPI00397ABE94
MSRYLSTPKIASPCSCATPRDTSAKIGASNDEAEPLSKEVERESRPNGRVSALRREQQTSRTTWVQPEIEMYFVVTSVDPDGETHYNVVKDLCKHDVLLSVHAHVVNGWGHEVLKVRRISARQAIGSDHSVLKKLGDTGDELFAIDLLKEARKYKPSGG